MKSGRATYLKVNWSKPLREYVVDKLSSQLTSDGKRLVFEDSPAGAAALSRLQMEFQSKFPQKQWLLCEKDRLQDMVLKMKKREKKVEREGSVNKKNEKDAVSIEEDDRASSSLRQSRRVEMRLEENSLNIHQLTVDAKSSIPNKNMKPYMLKQPVHLSARDLTVNSSLSALREKQLEKEEEERILEENWSKVHESLKRVRNLQDEIDGEPLSPFVFSICITSDARPDSAQYANQNRVLDDNVYKAIKIQNKYSSKVKGKIRKASSKKMRKL